MTRFVPAVIGGGIVGGDRLAVSCYAAAGAPDRTYGTGGRVLSADRPVTIEGIILSPE